MSTTTLTNYKEGIIKTKHGILEITTVHKNGIFKHFHKETLTEHGKYLLERWGGNLNTGKINDWAFSKPELKITKLKAWKDLNFFLSLMIEDFNNDLIRTNNF